MCFFAELNNFGEVLVVNVCIDPEESLQYCFCGRQKILWKRNSCKNGIVS